MDNEVNQRLLNKLSDAQKVIDEHGRRGSANIPKNKTVRININQTLNGKIEPLKLLHKEQSNEPSS